MSRDRNKCEVTEIERMAGEMDRLFAEAEMWETVTKKHTSILKAEALYDAGYSKQSAIITEFAVMLKKRLNENPSIFTQQRYIVVAEIDKLVEEMKAGE